MINHTWFNWAVNQNHDRLRLLKSKYLAEIAKTETHLSALRNKVHLIDELEADAEGLSSASNGDLKYTGNKLSVIDAAYDALKSLPGLNGTAPKVANYLKMNGWVPKGKNFNVTLGTALKRLEEKGKVVSERKDGSRIFKIKQVTGIGII